MIYKKIFLIKNRPLSDLLMPQEEVKVPIREVLREPKPKIIEPERKIIVEARLKEEPKKIEEAKQVETVLLKPEQLDNDSDQAAKPTVAPEPEPEPVAPVNATRNQRNI